MMRAKHVNFSVQFSTASAAAPAASTSSGGSLITCTLSLLSSLGGIVAAILATRARVDLVFLRNVTVKSIKIYVLPGSSPTGRLYATWHPGSSSPREFISNFDMRFIGTQDQFQVDPITEEFVDVSGDATTKTLRLEIQDHTAGQAIPYQITIEAEEYENE